MPESRKPFHRYPSPTFKDVEKFEAPFFINFDFYGKQITGEIQKNLQDKGYYKVTLDGKFYEHIHKLDVWMNFLGKKEELMEIVGKLIEEHEKM
jgi:hypothetical protein